MSLTQEELVKQLSDFLLKEQVSVNKTILEQHSKDESYHKSKLPVVVVYPYTTRRCEPNLKIC